MFELIALCLIAAFGLAVVVGLFKLLGFAINVALIPVKLVVGLIGAVVGLVVLVPLALLVVPVVVVALPAIVIALVVAAFVAVGGLLVAGACHLIALV